MPRVHVVGAGLAGAEAAWQAAERGVQVVLHEMRPSKKTPAHRTGDFAELVCSNSLKSQSLTNAAGLLKEELRRLDSLIMRAAEASRVPAGQALAVDRQVFAAYVTAALKEHPMIELREEEVEHIPSPIGEPWVIATGPLTSEGMAQSLKDLSGQDYLYFYDAVAPIVSLDSLNMSKVFRATRYDKGDADYLNCPMDRDEYEAFWQALIAAEQHPLHEFETQHFFEGCMPVEEMARRGVDTLAFGPMKPVGLIDPRNGKQPHAVVQLRQDNVAGDLFNLVGFQTNLRYGEQDRVFRMIPGLEQAEFVRYGIMHRNLFMNSPQLLNAFLQFKTRPDLFFAGQMVGVEGYIESAATGWLAGCNAARALLDLELVTLPNVTMLGALLQYITQAETKHFQPMNAVFGVMPPLPGKKIPKKQRNQLYSERSLGALEAWIETTKG